MEELSFSNERFTLLWKTFKNYDDKRYLATAEQSSKSPCSKNMISDWKKKFTAQQLSLHHDNPTQFVICQWQKDQTPSIIYLVYRWFIALYFSITWFLSVIDINKHSKDAASHAKWLIYLTNWGYTFCMLQSVTSAVMLLLVIISSRAKGCSNLQQKALKAYKFYWVTNIIATDVAFGITVLYWSLIYNPEKNRLDAMNIFVHAANSAMTTFDFWMTSHPIRLLQLIYPTALAVCYAAFTVIYFLAGGTSKEGNTFIYPILKWEKPGNGVLICCSVTLFLVLIHIFFTGLYHVKCYIHKKIFGKGKAPEDDTTIVGEIKTPKENGYINEAVANEVV